MKIYQSLILAAFLAAVPLLAGCENPSAPPKSDTSTHIMSGNNPKEKPLEKSIHGGAQPSTTVPGGAKPGAAEGNKPAPPGPSGSGGGNKPAANAPAPK